MSKNNNDIICVGEALIDFIGDELATNLTQTKSFSKYVGGSPTNVAKNMAQLGFNSTLI
ncbi:MAG: carbohydrate kinase, partial [Zetaproteobacteria bacterium]|nr:carbohydrate kinase [Zetaproteobacteria bacterium]NDK19172.1 carbohydrate kinase [Flavobacteriales bacterium]